MKYMGSKRFMLNNGLGELLRKQFKTAKRVVDPFCGAGSVVYFAAQNFNKEIIASDLQEYAAVLAGAIIGRTRALDQSLLEKEWLSPAERSMRRSTVYNEAVSLDEIVDIPKRVTASRDLCASGFKNSIWSAYGGHYYSPKQAFIFDRLLRFLPTKKQHRDTCLAALIVAASRCAASPGHTAQPFQPTDTASRFIKISWGLDPIKSCRSALEELCPLYAKVRGKTFVANAKDLIPTLKMGDLVILDPPYSGVQYSRFYHVLEAIARGHFGAVDGVGRYPALTERPQSAFSNGGQALAALEELIAGLAQREVRVIFTFPKGECSNGLSGDLVKDTVSRWFNISNDSRVHGHFSTLGGNNRKKDNRSIKPARVKSEELLLLLEPKR